MSGKSLAGTLILAIVVAFGAGFFVGQAGSKVVEGPTKAIQTHVKILMRPDHSCQQINSGSGGPNKVPLLHKRLEHTIIWDEGIAHGGPTTLVVTFPPTSNGHVGTPFVDANNNPKFTFTNGEVGRLANNPDYDTYLFLSATVGETACTNPQDPGVIVVN